MRIGTIMEFKSGLAVVLTDDCDFVKIRKIQGMELGQRIDINSRSKHNYWSIYNRKTIGVLLAACIMLGVLGAYLKISPAYAEPYAYVTLDINPSIELGINRAYEVISINYFNNDGKIVMENLAVKGQNVDIALKNIVDKAMSLGYFKNKKIGAVLITAVPNSKYDNFINNKTKVKDELSNLIAKEEELLEKAENYKVNISIETLNPETREQANEKDISAGRQYLIDNAKKSGTTDITDEEIKKANITELFNKHGANVLDEKALKDYQKDNKDFGAGETDSNVTENDKSGNDKKNSDKSNNDSNSAQDVKLNDGNGTNGDGSSKIDKTNKDSNADKLTKETKKEKAKRLRQEAKEKAKLLKQADKEKAELLKQAEIDKAEQLKQDESDAELLKNAEEEKAEMQKQLEDSTTTKIEGSSN